MSSAEAAVREYADAFSRGDLDRVVAFYHAPCIYITPLGVVVFPDADVARAGISVGMKQMRAQGYGHTEFVGLRSRSLSSDLAAISGTLVRISTDSRELNRVGFTYTLRLDEDRWKLVCAIIHDPPGD